MTSKPTKRAPPAPPGIRAGKVEMLQRADGVIVVRHDKRPTFEVEVPARMLEQWVMRQLREGIFA